MQRRASSAAHHQVFPPQKWGKHKQQQKTQNTHSMSKMDQTLQDNHMFICIHLTQEKNWHPIRETIITHTNFF